MAAPKKSTKASSYRSRHPLWQWIVLYVILGAAIYVAGYEFIIARSRTYMTPTPTSSPSATPLTMVSVPLSSENKSGETGTALFQEANGKTTVTITLKGQPKGASQPAHIHMGQCPGVGAVKFALNPIVNGTSTTVLPVTLLALKNQLPLAVNVHRSATAMGVYTACGAVVIK